ncbi:MAG TPA: NHL repeat-containing protein [Solirubrobacteraceae bacterium]
MSASPSGRGGSKIDEYSTEGKLEGSFERKAYGEHESFDYRALAVDPAGNIWATDQHNYQIDEFSPKGTFIAAYGTAGSGQKEFNGPDGIAIDHEEHIYVADINNHRILELSTTGVFIREFGFQGRECQINGGCAWWF